MNLVKNNQAAFTLVELAISLVVIGLIVGGILQGQELIRQAQIRSTISSVQEFNTAISTFRLKYNMLPGDGRNIAGYGLNCPKTGVACSGATDNVSDTASDAGADGQDGDGDGDNVLEASTNTSSNSANLFTGEIANFWVHLSNAVMIKGAYTQVDDCVLSTTCGSTVATNFPEISLPGAGAIALTDNYRTAWLVGAKGGFTTSFSAVATTAGSVAAYNLIPEDAFGIDSKLDDGKPNTGIVQYVGAYNLSAGGNRFYSDLEATASCASTTTASTGDYNLTVGTVSCILKVISAN